MEIEENHRKTPHLRTAPDHAILRTRMNWFKGRFTGKPIHKDGETTHGFLQHFT